MWESLESIFAYEQESRGDLYYVWFTRESWYVNHFSFQLIKKLASSRAVVWVKLTGYSIIQSRNVQPTQMLLLQGGSVVAHTRSKNASTLTISRLWLSTIFIFPNLDDKHYGIQSFCDVKVLQVRHFQTTWSCISKIRNFGNHKICSYKVRVGTWQLLLFSLICVHLAALLLELSEDGWWSGFVIWLLVWKLLGNLPSVSPHTGPQTQAHTPRHTHAH